MRLITLHRASDGQREPRAPDEILNVSHVPASQRGRFGVPSLAEAYVMLTDGRGGLYVIESVDTVNARLRSARSADTSDSWCAGCSTWSTECAHAHEVL